MSTIVRYNGDTIATVNHQKKILLTGGTWLDKNIDIEDTGGGASQDQDGYIVLEDDGVAVYTMDEIITHDFAPSILNLNNPEITSLYPYQFAYTNIVEIHAPYITSFATNIDTNGVGIFRGCTQLEVIDMPNLSTMGSGGYQFAECTSLENVYLPKCITGQYMFYNCTNLKTAVLRVGNTAAQMNGNDFYGCKKLTTVDIKASRVHSNSFYGCTVLDIIIIRTDSVPSLSNTSAFTSTPFASGKTGGTLYVPSALISEYEAATNWSTILGYENNQILPIEGSIYETQYANGMIIEQAEGD